MISNLPVMAAQQDFQVRHRDMLAVAQSEPLTKAEIERNRAQARTDRLVNSFMSGGQWQALITPAPDEYANYD